MTKTIVAVMASVVLAALPAASQTTAELLQKGIYAQETEGNLDNAILIYRQIVNSAPSQRDLAAQAQYRLAQALLQKGDLATASKEFERLARDYSDQSNLVSSLAAQMRPAPGGGRGGRGPFTSQSAAQQLLLVTQQARVAELTAKLAELRAKYAPGHPDIRAVEAQLQDVKKGMAANSTAGDGGLTALSQALYATEFDPSKPISLAGKVSQIVWVNPRSWINVETTDGMYTLVLAAPNTLVRTGKMTRATFTAGMDVTVTGLLAKDGSKTALANTISSDGTLIFDRSTLTQ